MFRKNKHIIAFHHFYTFSNKSEISEINIRSLNSNFNYATYVDIDKITSISGIIIIDGKKYNVKHRKFAIITIGNDKYFITEKQHSKLKTDLPQLFPKQKIK